VKITNTQFGTWSDRYNLMDHLWYNRYSLTLLPQPIAGETEVVWTATCGIIKALGKWQSPVGFHFHVNPLSS